MRILISLTYYRPHYSGLTIYVERLAKALARRGHHVTILTSRFDPALLARETRDGVQIVRPWVMARVSKGVLMPTLPFQAFDLIRQADLINVHVPQLDAAPIALLARLMRRPVVLTYHCDLLLPNGIIHRLANAVSDSANKVTARLANAIVTNTRDYAENSAFLRPFLPKIQEIPPAIELPEVSTAQIEAFRQKYGIEAGQKVIGMLARFATEKGVEHLVQAMPRVLQAHPEARVIYVGQHQNVMGEEAYAARLAPAIAALAEKWKFLGVLPYEEVAAFFHNCAVTVLPSLNSTESFGMVQVESMSCGAPVVASDLPGVRQPVKMTGMGRVCPVGNSAALAENIIQILNAPQNYRGDSSAVRLRFSPESIAAEYETLFERLMQPVRAQSLARRSVHQK